jgi:hypothetical protein
VLTEAQDKELLQWVTDQRNKRERVSIKMLKEEARRIYAVNSSNTDSSSSTVPIFRASSKWASGWMERQNLSLRLKTTGKEVTTEAMQHIAQDYRVSIEPIFTQYKIIRIYNMDEMGPFTSKGHQQWR